MSLETFNYLDSLVPANPPVSDGIVQGDDHIRGIKLALKNTFPNINGAVTATLVDLNAVTGGASVLADAGAFFKTSGDGFANTLAGDIDVKLQGTIAATFQRTGGVNFLKVFGSLQTAGITSTAEIKGPGITPIGSAVMWFDDTLPSDGLWAWANGQVISSANTVAPVLLARWGSRFGGDGITTMGLPNMQEVVPVGKSGMGGASAPGYLTSVSTALKTVLHTLFGSDTVTLTGPQMPSHFHTAGISDPGHSHGISGGAYGSNSSVSAGFVSGGSQGVGGSNTLITVGGSTTGIRLSSGNGLDTVNTTGNDQPHGNVQPSRVVAWIIRIG